MAYPNKGKVVPMSAVVEATHLVRKMIHRKASGPGESERAMRQIETDYGIGFWTQDTLRKGKAKTCDIGLFARIRAAYLDLCERQVATLLHEIAIEKVKNEDDDLGRLQIEALALASRIQEKKAAMK